MVNIIYFHQSISTTFMMCLEYIFKYLILKLSYFKWIQNTQFWNGSGKITKLPSKEITPIQPHLPRKRKVLTFFVSHFVYRQTYLFMFLYILNKHRYIVNGGCRWSLWVWEFVPDGLWNKDGGAEHRVVQRRRVVWSVFQDDVWLQDGSTVVH